MSYPRKMIERARFSYWAWLRVNQYPSYNLSHSQFGEDMVARALLEDRLRGRYIDIGAHHPVYYSNTYHFYCRGWSGINIDAIPGSMELFNVLRPRDTNIEACIGAFSGQKVNFYVFEKSAFSTFDKKLADQRARDGLKIKEVKTLQMQSLAQCVEHHLNGAAVDLMNVDIEGGDEQILMKDDWIRYRPKVLIFERQGLDLSSISSDPLLARLDSLSYRLAAKCGPSFLMLRRD